jgi:predicted lipid carrier protein YhbT
MKHPSRSASPFSPVLLAAMFERLSGLGDPVFLTDPIDLPLVFVLKVDARAPNLRCVANGDGVAAAAIRGPCLPSSISEERLDSNALLSTSELNIEGNAETVVVLHDPVDGAEVQVGSALASLLGPLAAPAHFMAGADGAVYSRLAENPSPHRRWTGPAPADTEATRLDGPDEAAGEINRAPSKSRLRKP